MNVLNNYTCTYKDDFISTYVVNLDILNHLNLLNNVHTIDETHWMNIYESFKTSYRNDDFNFPGILSICDYDGYLYLTKGYHRYYALRKLWKNNDKQNDICTIRVDVKSVTSYEEIINDFNLHHTNVYTYVKKDLENMMVDYVVKYMKDNFSSGSSSILKKTDNTRMPYINQNDLVDSLHQTSFLFALEYETINELIQNINNRYNKDLDMTRIDSKYLDIMYSYGCFLGLDTRFDWVALVDNEARKLIFSI